MKLNEWLKLRLGSFGGEAEVGGRRLAHLAE